MHILPDEKVAKANRERQLNYAYFHVNRREIGERYAGKFVVIYDQAVQYVFDEPEQDISDLVKRLTLDQSASMIIRYISR